MGMLNPQTFHNGVWRLCSTLQDHFQNMVGANVYLTPPGTQGFAPHWDDVEVFMLQLEGKKHWKIYSPRNKEETLPRFSSANLEQDEVGAPIIEVDLEPGDMIYMPRGTIHQGNCLSEEHSLHITISTYQMNSWTDLLEKLLPAALTAASQEDLQFRQGLPRDFLLNMGVAQEDKTMCGKPGHAETRCPERACLRCGQPGFGFLESCMHCRRLNDTECNECGYLGHISRDCPDLWRRFHSTSSGTKVVVPEAGHAEKPEKESGVATVAGK